MAEQTFKSPGFFEREIEVISRPIFTNTSTPVGVIGPAEKGPAFVPTTVTSSQEFFRKFGSPDQNRATGHAVSEFFRNNGKSLTFCRTLGTGTSAKDGAVTKAGFLVDGTAIETKKSKGGVHFLVANHVVDNAEHITYGIFNDNNSITTDMDANLTDGEGAAEAPTDANIQLVRAMIIIRNGWSMKISAASAAEPVITAQDFAATSNDTDKLFKLWFDDIDGTETSTSYVVSLDPSHQSYIRNVLNTDRFGFEDKHHYLYADFPVEDELASTKAQNVGVLRGADASSATYIDDYGKFDSRFTTAKTTMFFSQPFGEKEHNLFHFESLHDGECGSGKYKISISNLRASTDPVYKYGSFSVLLRDIYDTDENPIVYESFNNCSLDPQSDNFIAKVIGDVKLKLQLNVDTDDEKRIIREGKYDNNSNHIRVVVADEVMLEAIPQDALPFGFRGIPYLETTSDGSDGKTGNTSRLIGIDSGAVLYDTSPTDTSKDQSNKLAFSVLPPLPYRMKLTKGSMANGDKWYQTYHGDASKSAERVASQLYWGLKTLMLEDIKKPNDALATKRNRLVESLTMFLGNSSSVVISDQEKVDAFNNNKFSLSKVALSLGAAASKDATSVSSVTGTISEVFKEAVYIRNAEVGSDFYDPATKTIKMSADSDAFTAETSGTAKEFRVTLAKLLAEDASKFNKYSSMAKFTAPFCGGFDGVNILDRDAYYFTDRGTSTVSAAMSSDGVGGKAIAYTSGLSGTSNADMHGAELQNNLVISYRNAIRIMTDEMIVDHNVLVVPGIRDAIITDFVANRVKKYGKALYLMDIPHFDNDDKRIFVSSNGIYSGRPDVDSTSSSFLSRDVNSSYVATYFPDVLLEDQGDEDDAAVASRRSVRVPSSVVALGALAKTDDEAKPWFAPAGFSRGSLEAVRSVDVRLNAADRDALYEARINPIASFPNNQFVIFGQKTSQVAATALDRVNVRRLMIAIKRRIQKIAQNLLFEQNNNSTRKRFVDSAVAVLSSIQVNQGIEDFRVIMDDSNNTAEDIDNNRLNGKIVVVPTRAVEFIAIDFVITNSGVEFPS